MALRVILDADGVFMCERPYWRTALATALSVQGVDGLPRETFRALDRALFDERSAQQRVKAIGVNSNWYLSGALVGCAREGAVWRDLEIQWCRHALEDTTGKVKSRPVTGTEEATLPVRTKISRAHIRSVGR